MVCDAIMAGIRPIALQHGQGALFVSCGATLHQPDRMLDELSRQADAALYGAKRIGRGRAVMAQAVWRRAA